MDNYKARKIILLITVFSSGLVTLAAEFAASRLLSNIFGTSNIVWASTIGLIMVYLTLGYWLGGKLADKSPTFTTMFRLLIWAGFILGILPVIAHPILKFAADAFDNLQIATLLGSFTSILILLIIPITFLGMATPFALKISLTDTEKTGGVSGKLYALSTIGSFLGTFLTVLFLIPLLGTNLTFLVLGVFMVVICFIGLWIIGGWKQVLKYSWMLVLLILIGFWLQQRPIKSTKGQIFEAESSYNYIQVLEIGEYRYLRLNEGQGMHSIYHPEMLFYGGPWSQVLVAPLFTESYHSVNELDRMAILGMAGGTTARQAVSLYPQILIDGFEIDAEVINVSEKYFDLNHPSIRKINEDARWGIAHSRYKYDIVSIDAYRAPYIPSHMITKEFFRIVYDHLEDDGMMVINVGNAPTSRDLVNDLGSTISSIFPKIFIVDIPNTFNTIIFGSHSPNASWEIFEKNYEKLISSPTSDLLKQAMQITKTGRVDYFEKGRIYTDDKAPIEWVTNKIVVDFVFSGNMEDIK